MTAEPRPAPSPTGSGFIEVLRGRDSPQAEARTAAAGDRSATAGLAAGTASASDCRSQPGLGLMAAAQKKTLGPGALDRGFLCAFVTLDRAAD